MPSRILREGILDSKAVNSLSLEGEIFYRRLMSAVDDFGRYGADIEVLRADLFKRQLMEWPAERVAAALRECAAALTEDGTPLVVVFENRRRMYLEVSNFGQRVRVGQKSKFPAPTVREFLESREIPGNSGNPPELAGISGNSREFPAQSESESESNAKAESGTRDGIEVLHHPKSSQRFEEWWNLWSSVRGTSNRIQAGHAWISKVTTGNDVALFGCTRSYLASSKVSDGGGFNPENFIFEQAKDLFAARWPPARASPRSSDRPYEYKPDLDRTITPEKLAAERKQRADRFTELHGSETAD